MRGYEDWAAFWKGNPVYERLKHRWPMGWILESKDGQIVGSIGSIPLAYEFEGRELIAAAACSWVVDPGYRGHSMLLLDRLLRLKTAECFVCTTVSAASEPSYQAFQWSRPPVGTWDKSAFWITNYRGFSKSLLGLKSIPMASAMSYPVSAALFFGDKFKDIGVSEHRSTSTIDQCDDFDSRFDDFWDELKREKRHMLLPVRDRSTLRWHFRYSQNTGGIWILAISKKSRLTAYAVFDRLDNRAADLKRVRLVEFQALKGSENEIRTALCWMLQTCRRQGIHIIENTGCWADQPDMAGFQAPSRRTLPSWTYYFKVTNKALQQKVMDPAVWAPSSFDGDVSL